VLGVEVLQRSRHLFERHFGCRQAELLVQAPSLRPRRRVRREGVSSSFRQALGELLFGDCSASFFTAVRASSLRMSRFQLLRLVRLASDSRLRWMSLLHSVLQPRMRTVEQVNHCCTPFCSF
jgi:hypothetical protein